MTVFFFVVGLEVKREIVSGELRDPRNALLPVFGALGGVLAPAGIYLLLQWGEPGQRGWAIPMATDIAFVVGFLALFGRRVPFGLKIFLLSLAIVDDLVAVLIIAFVFTEQIAWGWLGIAAIGFALCYAFNRAGVRAVTIYVIVGVVIWLAFLESGVHPTVAGVLLGMITPASAWIGTETFAAVAREAWHKVSGQAEGDGDADGPDDPALDVQRIQFAARETVSPLVRLELALHPWVAFGVMPLFALANAGVALDVSGLADPIALAVAAGLAIGKPVGILAMSALAVRSGLTRLPDGVTWGMLTAGGCLAGIGFTMALFINGLAFPVGTFAASEAAGKIGTLTGSFVSAVVGATLLAAALKRAPAAANPL
jgi:NhaA family Na+:H+ antiporter